MCVRDAFDDGQSEADAGKVGLGPGSTFYLPVKAGGALFYVGDPHMGMGDGEVALTTMEGSLRRGTFRLTVCKPGARDAPELAHRYPFGETPEAWIPIGLSDPDGLGGGGVNSDLNTAMRRWLMPWTSSGRQKGWTGPWPTYLSATADFAISQVVAGRSTA